MGQSDRTTPFLNPVIYAYEQNYKSILCIISLMMVTESQRNYPLISVEEIETP